MLKLALIGVVLFLSVCAHANTDAIEQDLSRLEQVLQSDSVEADAILAKLYAIESELSVKQRARFLVFASTQKIMEGHYLQANEQLDLALSLPIDEATENTIYLYKVTVNIGLKRYTTAFELLEHNLAKIKGYGDTSIKISSYLRLINAYLDMGAYAEAKRYSEIVLSINQGEMKREQCYALVLLSYSELNLQHWSEAKQRFQQTKTFCKEHNSPLIVAMAVKGLGMLAIEQEDFPLAVTYLEDALVKYGKFDFDFEILRSEVSLARAYYRTEQFDKALLLAEKVNRIAIEPSNLEPKKQANDVLALLADKAGDFKQAYQYQVVASALGQQLIDDKRLKENAYQMARFDSAEKNRELISLQQEHQLLSKQQELVNREASSSLMFTTVMAGVIACLSLLLFAAWLQRNQFRKQVQRDGLTGIYNRATGQELAEIEFIHCLTQKTDFVVTVFDLDAFKLINDQFGHATGDWALKKISHLIDEQINSNEIFTRMGGEEFAIFSPALTLAQAVTRANKFRLDIASIDTGHTGHNFTINASFGISTIESDDLSLDPLLHRADLALQQAQANGKNQVFAL
jgi:diguanylate cyclase (GGDEF)-like protein